MGAKEFWLPPRVHQAVQDAEDQWAQEDLIRAVRDVFAGKLVNGAVIGGTATSGGMPVQSAGLQSGNYVAGSAGWRIDDAGNAEFGSGTFRGVVLAKSPSHRRSFASDSLNTAAGTYVVGWGGTGGTSFQVANSPVVIAYDGPDFRVTRQGLYMVTLCFEGNFDTAGLISISVRSGDVISPTTTNGQRQAGNICYSPTSGGFIISASTIVRLFNQEQVWAVFQNTVQADIFAGDSTFFHVTYLSDL